MTEIQFRNNHFKKEPEKYTGTPEEVVKSVKCALKHTVLEDEDFHISECSMSVNLEYSSKSYVAFYIDELKKKFPGLVKVQDTHITIHYPEGQKYDKPPKRSPDSISTSE